MDQPIDSLKPSRLLTKILQIFGLWPTTSRFSCIYGTYTFIFQLIFTFSYTGFKCINFLYMTDLDEITRAMFISLTELALIVKIINFYVRMEAVRNCLDDIKIMEIVDSAETKLAKEKLSLFMKIVIWYMTVANLAGIFSYASPLISSDPILPYPAWYPFDWKHNSMYYWIAYSYQVLGMIIQTHTLISIEMFSVFLILIAGIHLDILGMRLKNIGYGKVLSEDDNNELSIYQLIECIKLHLFIIRFVENVEKILSIPYFIQFMFSGIVLCVSAFQIAIMNPTEAIPEFIFYASFVMTMLTQLFLPCYFGNDIFLKSEVLIDDIYSSNWPHLSNKYRKISILYMERLKRPKAMMVGRIFGLTLVTFSAVLNKAYGLFAVLQNFVE